MEVLGDVDRPVQVEDFATVATTEFAQELTTDFNAQKAQGYGYEDLDGVEIWFSPIEHQTVLGGGADIPDAPETLQISIGGCFIDNGVEITADPLDSEPANPTKTHVWASLDSDGLTWKLTDIEWSVSTEHDFEWCEL